MSARWVIPLSSFPLPWFVVRWHRFFVKAYHFVDAQLADEYTRWILWMPVGLGSGIAFYFALQQEPSPSLFYSSCVLSLVSGCALFSRPLVVRFLMRGLCLASVGFSLAYHRVHSIDPHPMHTKRDPLFVEGTVRKIEHYATATQLFQKVKLNNVYPRSLPKAISISIRTSCEPLQEGDHLRLKADLRPLQPPCIPGGFDPQRFAFFQGVGASGFALTSPDITRAKPTTMSRWRHTLTRRLHEELAPPFGSIACSFVTGDMASIPFDIRYDFSASGLSHILGLHLSIVMGFCCILFYRLLAWIPYAGLYVNLQKMAAALSLGIGWVYLKVSGEGYPARRSFFMTSLALIAMILSRRPLSMRSVMICATFVFLTEPEAILSLSFQLTFGAVIALICFYERSAPFVPKPALRGWRRHAEKILRNSVLPTTTITLLTLPTVTYYFQQCSLQAVFSNLLAIPLTSVAIIPLGILALISLALPPAYGPYFFTPWIYSLKALVGIAHLSAMHLPFLYFTILPYPAVYFFLQLFGSLWILLWQRRWRWLGLVPLCVGCVLSLLLGWRPVFLYNPEQQIAAYLDPEHRTLWVSSKRRGRITAQRWGQAFGCPSVRPMTLPFFITAPNGRKIYVSQTPQVHDEADMYIFLEDGKAQTARPTLILRTLQKGQSYAIDVQDNRFVVTQSQRERRPWTVRTPGL